MKTTVLLATATGFFISASAQFFSAISARSGSPIHLQEIAANGEGLWIGKPTSSFCPSVVRKQGGCPKGKHTNFAGGDGTLAMGAEVPGGQQVYIDRDSGAVKYTIAHSGDTFGGITTGWALTQGESFGALSWRHGLIACPTNGADEGPWEVFAQVKRVKFSSNCLGFDALTTNETEPAAWQYT